MTKSLIKSLKAGPPPPHVVLLSDAMFFVRAIPVPSGSTPAEVATQVELALETLSPFPPAQLYHGHFWPAGASRALVFAAYRRRFSSEQTEAWAGAELVTPAFAALLGTVVQPNTTVIVPSAEGLTAIFWDTLSVPARVAFRAVPPDATEMEANRLRDELLALAPANRPVVLTAGPTVDAARSDGEIGFRSDAFESRLPLAETTAMDVRDKEALAALRRSRARDLALWRAFLGLVGVLVLLGLGELALIGSDFWLKTQQTRANLQRPTVEKIMTAQSLTTRINELSTKRLLPFEMISTVVAKKPGDVTFQRTATSGLYGLNVEAYTASPGSVSAFQSALSQDPAVERVEVRDQRTRDNVMTFTLAVTFRADAIKPAAASNP